MSNPDFEQLTLKPAAEVFTQEELDIPACDILADYYTSPETAELDDGDKLYTADAIAQRIREILQEKGMAESDPLPICELLEEVESQNV